MTIVLMGLGRRLAPVSWRSMKENFDQTRDSPHKSYGEVCFALRRFLDTKLIGLGFVTAELSSAVLS